MVDTQDASAAVTSIASDFATFGTIHLDVTDAGRALAFWRDLAGLELLSRANDTLALGVGGRTIVVLHPGVRGPVVREASGLYHLSMHLPSVEDFARAFVRLEEAGYFQYPTDHGTHLANYVDDPDGIGLELAFETPAELRATWDNQPGFEQGEHGRHWRAEDPRYLAWLRSHVPNSDWLRGLPAGTVIGHVHLRVADIDAALLHYRDTLGFTLNSDGRDQGFFDLSAGGSFPHRLACNNWESAGRPQRAADAAGMRSFTLQLHRADDLDAAIRRVESRGVPVERQAGGAIVSAPDGTRLLLTSV